MRLAKVENHLGVKEENFHFLEYTLTERIESLISRDPDLKEIFGDMRISRTLGQLSKIIQREYEEYQPNFYYCEATSTGVYVFGADGFLYPCSEAAGNPSFSIGRFVPRLEIDEKKTQLMAGSKHCEGSGMQSMLHSTAMWWWMQIRSSTNQ